MKKPGQNRGDAAENARYQAAAGNKQTNPQNGENRLFTKAKVRSESREPSQPRGETAFDGKQRLCEIPVDQATVSSGKQVIPVVSQRQGIKRYLKTKADAQNTKPRVRPSWEKEFRQPFFRRSHLFKGLRFAMFFAKAEIVGV